MDPSAANDTLDYVSQGLRVHHRGSGVVLEVLLDQDLTRQWRGHLFQEVLSSLRAMVTAIVIISCHVYGCGLRGCIIAFILFTVFVVRGGGSHHRQGVFLPSDSCLRPRLITLGLMPFS